MKIALLTFGGVHIGVGHLFRCLNIASWIDILGDEIDLSFHLMDMGKEPQDKAFTILNSRTNYPIFFQKESSLKNLSWDILIVDLLDTPFQIMNYLKKNSNMLVSIDNTSKSRIFSDININPLYYGDYSGSSSNDYIGPQYQIISPNYYNGQSNFNSVVKNILVIQGGADPFNLTTKIIKELLSIKKSYNDIKIHVVIGPANTHFENYIKLNKEGFIFHHDVKDMSNLLKNIDIAISSIGITAFEIASMGIPAVHVTSVKKEVETGIALSKLGVSIFSGLSLNSDLGPLKNDLVNLINDLSARKKMRDTCLRFFKVSFGKSIIHKILGK
jgi:UDP-2,4-diacetamido-2,4,6-trideoxy-beta-L-altropyranose hydrolase